MSSPAMLSVTPTPSPCERSWASSGCELHGPAGYAHYGPMWVVPLGGPSKGLSRARCTIPKLSPGKCSAGAGVASSRYRLVSSDGAVARRLDSTKWYGVGAYICFGGLTTMSAPVSMRPLTPTLKGSRPAQSCGLHGSAGTPNPIKFMW